MNRRGFLLVEASLTYLILGLALVSLLPVFMLSLRSAKATEQIAKCTHLAVELMEEVKLRRWDELTPQAGRYIASPSAAVGVDAGESALDKRTFDDVDDFNGWTEKSPLNPVMQPLGSARWISRTVTVQYVTSSGAASGSPTDYKRITACAAAPRMKPACLSTLVTNR